LIQLVMNWAQKTVSPVRATLIYASEPIWGGLVGRPAGDRIPSAAVFGAALIVLAPWYRSSDQGFEEVTRRVERQISACYHRGIT